MKKITFILLALSAIGLISQPVKADDTHPSSKGDQVIIQDARQESYVGGSNNTSIQQSTQINKDRRGRRNSDNSGIVQTSDQYSDVVGEGNLSEQKVRQVNINGGRERKNRHDGYRNDD